MEPIIVYVDDAPYARRQLVPMRSGTTHWVLVACPPRMTQRIGKWVSHSAREKWRRQWSARLFAQLQPLLQGGGDRVTTVIAKAPLPALTRELMTVHGACRVLDARRPRFGHDLPPVTSDQPAGSQERWQLPGALAGVGAALVLAAE
jgi:hypothetical protein